MSSCTALCEWISLYSKFWEPLYSERRGERYIPHKEGLLFFAGFGRILLLRKGKTPIELSFFPILRSRSVGESSFSEIWCQKRSLVCSKFPNGISDWRKCKTGNTVLNFVAFVSLATFLLSIVPAEKVCGNITSSRHLHKIVSGFCNVLSLDWRMHFICIREEASSWNVVHYRTGSKSSSPHTRVRSGTPNRVFFCSVSL